MEKIAVLKALREIGLVPVLRAQSVDQAMALAAAVAAGGVTVLEITMTVPGAASGTTATIQLSTAVDSATLVYQVDYSSGVLTISPLDITQAANLATLEQILFGPSTVADGRVNLIGALRRSMATTGYSDLKEFQRVDIVVAPYHQA